MTRFADDRVHAVSNVARQVSGKRSRSYAGLCQQHQSNAGKCEEKEGAHFHLSISRHDRDAYNIYFRPIETSLTASYLEFASDYLA